MADEIFEAVTLEVKNKICAHFGRTLCSLENDVSIITTWCKTQPHLPEIPSHIFVHFRGDAMIEKFLILNKFDIEKTKQKLDAYYTIRPKLPEILHVSSVNPTKSQMMAYSDINYLIPLPKLTTNLYRVIVFKIMSTNTDVYNPIWSFISLFALSEIRMLEDWNIGTVFICDGENCSFEHLVKITPVLLRKAQTIFKKVFSASVEGVHFINCPEKFDTFLKFCKTILSAKILDRIFVHNEADAISKYISKDLLPSDYGGNEKSLKELNEILQSKFMGYQKYFDHLDGLVVDETFRSDNLSDDEIFGCYGNFKQLNID